MRRRLFAESARGGRFATAGLLGCLALASCLPLRNSNVRVLEDYLTAEEVEPEQLADVVDLSTSFWRRQTAQDYLIGALYGPGEPALANLDLRFAHSYRRLTAPSLSEADYVRTFVDNAWAVYQARAASALGIIGEVRAEAGLRTALREDVLGARVVRSDVRDAFHRGLVAAGTSPFTGALSDSIGAILDTITVSGGPFPFDGDERVRLTGGPFPDDVMVDSLGPAMSFVLAAPIGTHYARLMGAPPGGDQRIRVQANRITYVPASPGNPPEMWEHPSRHRLYTVLTGAADTVTGGVLAGAPVDYYELNPPLPTRARATVEWAG